MAKLVVVETPFGEHFIPAEKFNLKGYEALRKAYKKDWDEIIHDPDATRFYMRAYHWDEDTGEEEDIADFTWSATENGE